MTTLKKDDPNKHLNDIGAPPDSTSILDPSYEINTEALIKKTYEEIDVYDQKFLAVFETLRANNSHIRYQTNHYEMSKHIAELFSSHFMCNATLDTPVSHSLLSLGWTRLLADLDAKGAAYQLMQHSIDNQLNDEFIIYWANAAFNQIYKELKECFREHDIEKIMIKMHELIDKVSVSHPKLAINFARKLITACHENRQLSDETERAKKTFNSLANRCSGVVVLGRIEPSGDRVTRSNCERYQELSNMPIELVPIGNIDHLQQKLDLEFPWFSSVTAKICQSLRLRCLGSGDFFLPPMLLLGTPGIGKTSFLNRLAELSNVPFKVVAMAGKNDNRDLVGTSRGWGTGHPGMPISFINEHRIANPIIQLDEMDKCAGSDHNGRALDSLLTLFEASTSSSIYDEYLCANCDYSHISWISSANSVKQLPTALLSRLEVITVQAPLKEHYPRIVKSSINSFCVRNRIDKAHIPEITEADWHWLGKYFKSPRIAQKATEKWLAYRLLTPEDSNRLN